MRANINNFLILIGLLLTTSHVYPQYSKVANFTTNEGLPSNWTYKTLLDTVGYLWLSTNQGLARFDGKHFQLFTTFNGLPDNEILHIIKEKNGKVWVKGVNKKVAYFNPTKNKFINAKDDKTLIELEGLTLTNIYPLLHDGIYFPNFDTSFLFQHNQWKYFTEPELNKQSCIVKFNIDTSEIRIAKSLLQDSLLYLNHTKNNKIIETYKLCKYASKSKFYIDDENIILVTPKSKIVTLISAIKTNPLKFKIDSLELKQGYYYHSMTENYLAILYANGQVDLYDKNSLKLVDQLNCENIPNGVTADKDGDIWISTPTKGLFQFRKQQIKEYELSSPYKNQSWFAITKFKNSLLIGNSSGEVVECNHKNNRRQKINNSLKTDLQRHIIVSQNKVFTFGEGGIYVNYTTEIKRINKSACKSAYAFNDSIIFCSFSDGLGKINSLSNQLTELKIPKDIYIKCITKLDDQRIYLGTTSGLYVYNFITQSIETTRSLDDRLSERIVGMTVTSDGMLWIATATIGIIAFNHNKILKHYTETDGLMSNTSSVISSGSSNQIWIGSNQGISIIDYTNKFPWIQNLSINDGLSSNVINQMYYDKDTMYVATDNGISVIPSNISISKFNIPIEITSVKINNKDTILTSEYKLETKQNNIIIQYAGVELTGHFKNAQYSMDGGVSWTNNEGISLSLQLASGEHSIMFRAIDVNGNISSKTTSVKFDIEKPIYEKWWFWLIIALIALLSSIYIYTLFTKRKHQKQIEQFLNQQALDEFEIQALKAQINPHFVFNCLNSIKGIIYDEDFEKANLYLNKFALMLRNTLNFSSQASIPIKDEIAYIDNYLSLEKLRFGNKFEYSIKCDDEVPQDEIFIPAMLLQPFVENALNHGVNHLKEKQGIISIQMYLANESLVIAIDDNGIGRERANELNKQRNIAHESKGTKLTDRRMKLYRIEYTVYDKNDEEGKSLGTAIHLKIPIPLS